MPKNDAVPGVLEDALRSALTWELQERRLPQEAMLDIVREPDGTLDCWVFVLEKVDPDSLCQAVSGAMQNAQAICEHQHGLLLETVDVRADPRAGRGWTLVKGIVREQAVERQDVPSTG